jgi:GDP-L-fucose synthase
MARMHAAKLRGDREFVIWGDGTARRELLYSDDLARALLLVMEGYNSPAPINTGSGEEITVRELAHQSQKIVGYEGEIVFDPSQPVGVTRKIMDNSKIFQLGWSPRVNLRFGLNRTYDDFLNNPEGRRGVGG